MSANAKPDPLETVARVAEEKRPVLLRVYRGWLRREDLEDCFSQATLELIARARRGGTFQSVAHVANALEQKLCSRIHDRRRALAGRSAVEAAIADALPLGDPDYGGIDLPDPRADTHETVTVRLRLRHLIVLARGLTYDQRLVLASQLQLDLDSRELCARLGWSQEKYRKVAQRGRARLRLLVEDGDERDRDEGATIGARLPHQRHERPARSGASERAPEPTYEIHRSRS